MAVVTIYMSDRDKTGKTFVSKKDADEHDKKLELAENLGVFLSQHLGFLNEKQTEDIGFLLAEHRELLAQALKGKPELLLDVALESKHVVEESTATADNTADTTDTPVNGEQPVADKKVRAIGR